MRIEVVCIGDELLRGDVVNTNLTVLGEALAEVGLEISRETCIPDDLEDIVAVLKEALSRSQVTITIGGLGPTRDDVTRQAVAEVLGVPLDLHEDVINSIHSFLQGRAIPIPEQAVRNQATIPENAAILPNETGTAPGLWCEDDESNVIVSLPGPPREFRPMVIDSLLPRLTALRKAPMQATRRLIICGLPESAVEEALTDIVPPNQNTAVSFCARPDGLTLRLTSATSDATALDEAESALRRKLGDRVLPPGCPDLVAHIGSLLEQRDWMLGLAESCTGGLIAARITEVSGVSAWFAGSAVTYSNEWKRSVLGVPEEILRAHGAVSEPTVRAMITGVRERLGVDAAIGVSGVAGPAGGSPLKPVGTVVIGVSAGQRQPAVSTYRFPGNRETIRLRSMGTALAVLRDELLAADRE